MNMVAIDLHIRNSFLHASSAGGELIRKGRIGNTLAEFAEFLAPLESEPMRVVMENTGNSRAMVHLLRRYAQDAGVALSAEILDARKLRVIAESVSKCDRLDAAVLCELACSNLKLPSIYVPDDEVFALREHLRSRADLVRVRTMLKNRVHAALHRRGLWSPQADGLFTQAGLRWLKEVEFDAAGREIVDRYLSQIESMDASLKSSTASVRKLSGQQRWCHPAALLCTIPGVGLITSMTILAELGDVDRFHGRASVSNYAGLVPVLRSSNEKHYSGGITHRGPPALRSVLVEASWVAISRVPLYRSIYDRVATRRGKQVAIVAVARRMLEDSWIMLRRKQVFRITSASCGDVDRSEGSDVKRSINPSVAG